MIYSLNFMMSVNGDRDFEAQKSAQIHHKKVLHMANKSLLKQIDVFVYE